MIFKNLITYIITRPLEVHQWEHRLRQHMFDSIAERETVAVGWSEVAPGELHQKVDNAIFVRMRIDSKIIPPAAIRREVDMLVKKIELHEDRKVRRGERMDLQDEITQEKLPTALVKSDYVNAIIDLKHDRLMVDSSSTGPAEMLTALLRETLEKLLVLPLTVDFPVTGTLYDAMMAFTDVELTEPPLLEIFDIGGDCVLEGNESGKVILRDMDLTSCEVTDHLRNDMFPTALELQYRDRLRFMLHSNLQLKKLKFLDAFMNEVVDHDSTDFLTSQRLIVLQELRTLIHNIVECLGGNEGDDLDDLDFDL